jgi:hypothetical protein
VIAVSSTKLAGHFQANLQDIEVLAEMIEGGQDMWYGRTRSSRLVLAAP